MRKLWLTFTAMLLCSISAFAQLPAEATPNGSGTADNPYLISNASEFVWIANHNENNKYYEQTADIDLGDLGTLEASIIPNFTGIYDGKGYIITYRANFTGANNNTHYSLFGYVGYDLYFIGIINNHIPGTIRNLNVNANVGLSGTQRNMDVALLCGTLGSLGVIENCNVSGDIISTVTATGGGGSDAGLLVGECAGTVRYCTGTGNVVGVGYAGGLIGQMAKADHANQNPSIIACSFVGSVTANYPDTELSADYEQYGNFAGGICGHADNNTNISFCTINGSVNRSNTNDGDAEGIICSAASSGASSGQADVANCYGSGTVDESPIDADNDLADNNGVNGESLYYKGEDDPYDIMEALNNAIPTAEQDKFYFDVINDEVVLIMGQRPTEEPDQPETPNYTYYRTIKPLGGFNESTTWEASVDGNDPWVENVAPAKERSAYITIREGHKVTVSHDLVIRNDYKITANNGVLQITQQGQLINTTTDENVPGIVEIVSPQKNMNSWTFIGAPFGNTYELGTIYPMSHDISVSKYDYSTANWSESWAHVGTQMEAGEGYFAWPFYDGAVTFTTYGDVWDYAEGKVGNYVFNGQTATNLNNTDVVITKENLQGNANTGRWMALANPYPAKLSVSEFVADNNIQGGGIYRLTSNTSNGVTTYTFVDLVGEIAMTEGFFVNLPSGNQVTFSKEQLTDYPTSAKSQVAPREFVELSLVKGNHNSKLYFAHNQEAEQNYDIFDANKLFALGEVAEPYFVTDGIALVKEEVKELPYYATMNVRSFANDTVSFVVNNIPEGLAVSIIDGENVIDMVEGGVYTTEILTGENADRFKVLIKKNLGIADVEELEVNITNNNRHISIETTETDLQVEVYNALGQKVLSTKDRNFTLNQVSAGAYLIKAFNNKASKTQKIVVE